MVDLEIGLAASDSLTAAATGSSIRPSDFSIPVDFPKSREILEKIQKSLKFVLLPNVCFKIFENALLLGEKLRSSEKL